MTFRAAAQWPWSHPIIAIANPADSSILSAPTDTSGARINGRTATAIANVIGAIGDTVSSTHIETVDRTQEALSRLQRGAFSLGKPKGHSPAAEKSDGRRIVVPRP
jgi:hypothetical protein